MEAEKIWLPFYTGLVLGCWDFKSHFGEIWKFCNWPENQHKMGLDVFKPLYPFPSPFLLKNLVNATPATDDIFKCISLNEKFRFSIEISQKYVPWGIIGNKSALVQIMAWQQAIIWTNDGLFFRHIHVSLGLSIFYPILGTWFWNTMQKKFRILAWSIWNRP